MANGVVATSKALKEEQVVCVSKEAGKHVRQRDQLGYTDSDVSVTLAAQSFDHISFLSCISKVLELKQQNQY